MKPGTPAEALEEVRRHVIQDRVRVTNHASQQMEVRGVSRIGLRQLLITSKSALLQPNGKWLLDGGVDEDRDSAKVVVAIDEVTIVVTVFE